MDVDSVTWHISSPHQLDVIRLLQASINGLVNTYWVTVFINYKHITPSLSLSSLSSPNLAENHTSMFFYMQLPYQKVNKFI